MVSEIHVSSYFEHLFKVLENLYRRLGRGDGKLSIVVINN